MVDHFPKPMTVSIVINTLNRASSLENTLRSLRWLKYDGDFEVIVVNGPSSDHTEEVIERWDPSIRAGRCSEANLSKSRNIGICMAQGDIVAFIDDDGIPEPEWLTQIVEAYDSEEVAAAGGLVYDHTGYEFQYRYCLVDRMGTADLGVPGPTPHLCFPGSRKLPHLLGTNSTFRRSTLLQVGGFDEEFEYFLDETDLCLRLIDAGYVIRQLPCAFVHHKFAPSNLRNSNRVARNRYPILKNKIYFTLKHGRDYASLDEIFEAHRNFIAHHRADVKWCSERGLLSQEDAAKFERDVEKALDVGIRRGFEGVRELITPRQIAREAGTFLPFPVLRPAAPQSVVLVSKDYPPGAAGGIATFSRDLAVSLAASGHIVHVVSQSRDINRVDFEDGVWVHRILAGEHKRSAQARELNIPGPIWNWSMAALGEIRRIATHRPIAVVEAPLWDCEGIAVLLHGDWPVVTSLHTPLAIWLKSNPQRQFDADWMNSFGRPMLALEKELMQNSHAVRANSAAIRRDIEAAYGFRFADEQISVIPHGLATGVATESRSAEDRITVLFVGRLEHRKGIDVLLRAIPRVLQQAPAILFRIVGEQMPPARDTVTYEAAFLAENPQQDVRRAVRFEGRIDDAAVLEAYASCDVFVAPSRYESFGLIFLEAMRAGKPIVGCNAGGVPEVVQHEHHGLLVAPDDDQALAEAILRLVTSEALRKEMGMRGRQRFEAQFTAGRMAAESLSFYARTRERCNAAVQ